jgi:hypothetical protein
MKLYEKLGKNELIIILDIIKNNKKLDPLNIY